MPATIAVREVHPDLPTDRMWQQGRRLYARCGRHSRLSEALHAMGAKWDMRAQALWVGSGKRDTFTPLALEHHATATRTAAVRDAGHWVAIPYEATLIRSRAKELGALWDPESKRWAMPTPADQLEILDLVQVWQRARDAERAEQRRLRAEEREIAWREARLEAAGARERSRQAAARSAAAYRTELATTVGRELTGALEQRREVYPRFTSRADAHESACTVGEVIRLDDGRRALVTKAKVAWVPAEEAATLGQEHAHWYVEYQLAVVAPTEAELDAEMGRARASMDAGELQALVVDAALLSAPVEVDRWTPVPEPQGVITVTGGINGLVPAGQLLLARDGTLWWQHPGHYDDYIPAEGTLRDAELADRMRQLLADGARRRTLPTPAGPVHYQVEPHA
ncbi:hypothetical protein ACWCV5_32735 [Streptomyces tubercidicus]